MYFDFASVNNDRFISRASFQNWSFGSSRQKWRGYISCECSDIYFDFGSFEYHKCNLIPLCEKCPAHVSTVFPEICYVLNLVHSSRECSGNHLELAMWEMSSSILIGVSINKRWMWLCTNDWFICQIYVGFGLWNCSSQISSEFSELNVWFVPSEMKRTYITWMFRNIFWFWICKNDWLIYHLITKRFILYQLCETCSAQISLHFSEQNCIFGSLRQKWIGHISHTSVQDFHF